jgi:hypothetical protein
MSTTAPNPAFLTELLYLHTSACQMIQPDIPQASQILSLVLGVIYQSQAVRSQHPSSLILQSKSWPHGLPVHSHPQSNWSTPLPDLGEHRVSRDGEKPPELSHCAVLTSRLSTAPCALFLPSFSSPRTAGITQPALCIMSKVTS